MNRVRLRMVQTMFFGIISLLGSYTISISSGNENELEILGDSDFESWYSDSKWNSSEIDDYESDISACKMISEITANDSITFLILAASWCKDTKTELPKIIKVMRDSEINSSSIILSGVGRDKKILNDTYKYLNITHVPTLIILRNNSEQGRIEEFPKICWEQDILEIISK
ncbi:MAG: thioredoxin family protein [Candidatus Kapaibacterium sp.]|nr:thioredoxin family protein [Candidatus Kapabacteria bacterium]